MTRLPNVKSMASREEGLVQGACPRSPGALQIEPTVGVVRKRVWLETRPAQGKTTANEQRSGHDGGRPL